MMGWKRMTEDAMFIFDCGTKVCNPKYYIKYVVLFFMDIVWKMALMIQPRQRATKYELSICGIFRDEAPFIKEWIDYHRALGVEHFYLYNNLSADNYREILQPYIEQGVVTLTDWDVVPPQKPAYRHFLEHYKSETHWVSFLDIDEFFCPLKDNSITEWLQRFRSYPVVMVYWRMFASSGLKHHDFSKPVTSQYTYGSYKLLDIGKIFYNTNFPSPEERHMDCIHSQIIRYHGVRIPPVNQFGYFATYGTHRWGGRTPDIQCNHYWSKASEEFKKKAIRPDGVNGGIRTDMFDLFNYYESICVKKDLSIERNIQSL